MATMTIYGLELPDDVRTLEGFRRWASTLGESGPRIHFCRGRIHIEMSPQHGETHGPLAQAINKVLDALKDERDLGRYFLPPTWFTHEESGLSTEPDGFLVRWDALRPGRFRLNPARKTEWLGRPDMALEVVSGSSVKKDLHELVRDYALAGVEEYWIADGRGGGVGLRILVLEGDAYRDQAADAEGWVESPFWGKKFRAVRFLDRAGIPDFRLEVR